MPVKISELIVDKVPEETRSFLEDLATCAPEELTKRPELGSINFEEIEPVVRRLKEAAQQLLSLPLDCLSESKMDEFSGQVRGIINPINNLRAFDIAVSNNPKSDRDGLVSLVKSQSENFLTYLIGILPYLILKSPDFHSAVQNSTSVINEIKKQAETKSQELESQVNEKIEKLNNALEIVQNTAAQTGVARHSQKFKDAADSHEKASRNWLTASVVLLVVTVLVAIAGLYLFPVIGEVKDASIIQRIIAKAVLISLLYYSAIWSAKNYRAHRHLAVLNSHRQNALETFETFVQGAGGDEQTKNAVLLEATRCIFSHVNSGYLDGDDGGSSNSIIELVKTVGSSSSGK